MKVILVRNNINPIWDWGFHTISFYIYYLKTKILIILKKDIKKNNSNGNGIVTKFKFILNNKMKLIL